MTHKDSYFSFLVFLKLILYFQLNQDILENIFSVVRAMGGAQTNPCFGQLCDRLRIISMTRSDNIACLLSDSCKYQFAGGDKDIDQEFGCNDFVNHSEGLKVDSAKPSENVESKMSWEALTYVAGYLTHKVIFNIIPLHYKFFCT